MKTPSGLKLTQYPPKIPNQTHNSGWHTQRATCKSVQPRRARETSGTRIGDTSQKRRAKEKPRNKKNPRKNTNIRGKTATHEASRKTQTNSIKNQGRNLFTPVNKQHRSPQCCYDRPQQAPKPKGTGLLISLQTTKDGRPGSYTDEPRNVLGTSPGNES